MKAFSDRLIERTRRLGHPLCIGFDPHLAHIPPAFRRGSMAPGDPETAAAVGAFCQAAFERVAEHAAAIKPQSAFFEALGPPGVQVLADLLRAGRRAGVPVILDVKRGDIGSTAEGYAGAYLAADAPMRADAITAAPYLGGDSLDPFVGAAAAAGGGVFVLVRTSNPGAADLQDLKVDGAPVYEAVARMLAPAAEKLMGAQGFSGLGVVVGATWPEQAPRVRELLPKSLFLVPGYGAQGGGAADAVRGFVAGPNGLEGGVVSSSRGVLFPEAGHTEDAAAWEAAIDQALDRARTDLAEAVSR